MFHNNIHGVISVEDPENTLSSHAHDISQIWSYADLILDCHVFNTGNISLQNNYFQIGLKFIITRAGNNTKRDTRVITLCVSILSGNSMSHLSPFRLKVMSFYFILTLWGK